MVLPSHEAVRRLTCNNVDDLPLDWAATQNNLGNALVMLGLRESGIARLREAVEAFQAALEERTRDRVPLQWAMTQNNLGAARMLIAERRNDLALATHALKHIEVALEVFSEAEHEFYTNHCAAQAAEACALIERLREAH